MAQHHDHAGHDHADHGRDWHDQEGHDQEGHHQEGHGHAGHGLFGGHHHHHGGGGPPERRWRSLVRFALAVLVVVVAGLAASAVMVSAGQAVVVTRLGDPVRVLMRPGLAWKLPPPLETLIPVDLRLRTTGSGLQDVGTRDGLRILVQAYAAWQVGRDPDSVRQFVRAVRNDPDEAARQLRSFIGSALQVTASSFALADLVDTDPARIRLDAFRAGLKAALAAQMKRDYGIVVQSVGLEQLSLPEATLAATVSRMRTERETVAAERTAEGLRAAAEIRSDAARDSRIEVAKAQTEAADIEAASRREAATIQARAYSGDPQLYMTLRSLDTLAAVIGPNARLVLRTDAAPFTALIEAPKLLPVAPVAPPPGAGSGIAAK